MEAYKQEFIAFMLEAKALQFGSFTLKSGRQSPFFMNAGAYVTGAQLEKLGEYYAKAIADRFGLDFDLLFGPAYKGIPLAVTTAAAIHRLYGKEVRYGANRKEAKDHGDAGVFLGSAPREGDRVLLIEDVTTSGQSVSEVVPLVSETGAKVCGLMVSLDRQEKAPGSTLSAQENILATYGFPASAIVSMKEVTEVLSGEDSPLPLTDEIREAIRAYYAEYGADSWKA